MVTDTAIADAGRGRRRVLLLILLAFAAAVASRPPLPQDVAYHRMADGRPAFGVPNCLDVVSNAPFALVGAFGLAVVFRRRPDAQRHPDPWLRAPHVAIFAGTALTAAGSSYYHLAPDNARLVWDRLPMTVVLAGLLTAVLAECVGRRQARRLFVPLLVCAAASVAYWAWTERSGVGDLRPYALVQYGTLLAIVSMLVLFRGRFRGGRYLAAGLLAYGLAKAFELADAPVFAMTGHVVSGHTLKHLAAVIALACVAAMVRANAAEAIEAHEPRD